MDVYDVVALGELLIDFTWAGADGDGYPTLAAHPGGAPGNFLAALSAYGCKTAMIGKVGSDAFGELLLKSLDRAGVDRSGVVVDDSVFTTLAFVTLDEQGERSFSFARKPGADTCLTPAEVPGTLIDRCRVLHFGTLSLTQDPAREATRQAVRRAKAAGRWLSFDPNLRPPLWDDLDRARAEMLWGLGQADIVKLSGEEADFLWHCGAEEAAGHLHGLGVKLAFVTLGAEGCLVSGNGLSRRVPALEGVRPVDTTGAGDIFGGAALSRLLQTGKGLEELTGEEMEQAARFGCAAAGLSTRQQGGMTSVPSLEDVLARSSPGPDIGDGKTRIDKPPAPTPPMPSLRTEPGWTTGPTV